MDDEQDVVRDGEKVSLPFFLRDSARRVDLELAGRTLRCLDTGRARAIDPMTATAIASEAAKARLPVKSYLRTRLRYELEN